MEGKKQAAHKNKIFLKGNVLLVDTYFLPTFAILH